MFCGGADVMMLPIEQRIWDNITVITGKVREDYRYRSKSVPNLFLENSDALALRG